jgi:4-hydroxy-3-polyprenylbenzoate decarboxylase
MTAKSMLPPPKQSLPIVLAMTGASGAAYGVRLLQRLAISGHAIHLLISPSAGAVLAQELQIDLGNQRDSILPLLSFAWPISSGSQRLWHPLSPTEIEACLQQITVHDYRNYMTPVASGSFLTAGMVICPCSGATLSGIVHASGNNLIQRAADVHLKEHRKLILVPRETPMSVFQLENMHRAAQAGAIVMPAMPGWYHGVTSPVDLIDFVVARILDHLGVHHELMQRWAEEPIECDDEHRRTGEE